MRILPTLGGIGSELAQQVLIDSDMNVEGGIQWIPVILYGSCPCIWHPHCHVKLSAPGSRSSLVVLENRQRLCRAGRSGSQKCDQIPLQRCCSGKGLYKDREVFWECSHTCVFPSSRAKYVGSQPVPLWSPSLVSQTEKIERHSGEVSGRRFASAISQLLYHE